MNTRDLPGRLNITRMANSGMILITVRDERSRTRFLEVTIAPEQFALALTGMAEQPCVMETRHLDRVGLQMQTKIIHIKVSDVDFVHCKADAMCGRLLTHEVDGWEGNVSDLTNPKRRCEDGKQAVTFYRWIATEDIKPCPKP